MLHDATVDLNYKFNSPRWNPPWHGEEAYLTKWLQPSTSKKRAHRSDAATFDQSKRIFFMLLPRTWFKVEEFRLEYNILIFNIWLISYITIYLLFSSSYHIFFSSWSASWSFAFGDEIWNFRYGDEGTWQMYPVNIHNTSSLIRTSQVYLRHLAVGRIFHGGRIHTHTHTHTHAHTHTHTHDTSLK